MKLTDIPPHVTQIDPPWFNHEFFKKYGQHPGNDPPDFDDVEPCFHLSYYDGPLSGIFRFGGHYFYARCIYDLDRQWWAAWELTEEETSATLHRHDQFQKHVGTHTSYAKDDNGNIRRDLASVRPQEEWDAFYKNENLPKVDYDAIMQRDIFGILKNPFRSR